MNLTPPRRRQLYRVTQAALALLVLYGVITVDASVLWAALMAAILEIPIAHVPEADE